MNPALRATRFTTLTMKNLETSYSGATEEIEDFCSVKRNSVSIGQAIDLAGEQTGMKSAKTAGN